MVPKGNLYRLTVLWAGFLLAALIAPHSLAQTGKLSIVTAATYPPMVDSANGPGFLNMLADALFKRVGVEFQLTALPAERALMNVNAGLDDGDIARTAIAGNGYPNLIRVPESVVTYDFIAYARDPAIRIRSWADLKPYSVAYPSGWKIFDANVKNAREITVTPTIHELFPLLQKGRTDVVLLSRWVGQWLTVQDGYSFKPMEPPLARLEMFMHLNNKHATLVPKLAQALRDMKADGSYQNIYDATLKPLDTR